MTANRPTRPRSGRAARALLALVVACAPTFSIVFSSCSSSDAQFFETPPGVQDVWVVQKDGGFERPRIGARPGRVRVTLENHMETATRVVVVRVAGSRTVADFPVGRRQVNWQDVELAEGEYEVVAYRVGGETSRCRLSVTGSDDATDRSRS